MESITRAYRAEGFFGSYFTAPLKAYECWFQNKIEVSPNSYQKTAWKICHVVTGIFAYLTLGALALLGIMFNLIMSPAKELSRKQKVDQFCSNMEIQLSLFFNSTIVCLGKEGNISLSRGYTYKKWQPLIFEIQKSAAKMSAEQIEAHFKQIRETIHNLSQQYQWFPELYTIQATGNRAVVTVIVPDHIPIAVSREGSLS